MGGPRGWGWLCVALLGCRGETVEPPSTSGSDAGSESDACAPLTDNLLANGSFEIWSEAACVGWSGPLTRTDDRPFDCASAVRVSTTNYEGIVQPVDLPAPLTAGAQLEISAAVRWVSGATGAPAFVVLFLGADGATLGQPAAKALGYKADGAWHEVTATIAAPAGATWMRLAITATVPEAQVLDYDQVAARLAK